MATLATSEHASSSDAGERAPASGGKDAAHAPAAASPGLSALLSRPGAGPPGGRLPGKAQLLKEIQRSYGNAYAQQVIELYRQPPGAAKGEGGKEAGGGKGEKSGKDEKGNKGERGGLGGKDGKGKRAGATPPPDKMAALLRASEKAEARGERSGRGAVAGKSGARKAPATVPAAAAPAGKAGAGGGGPSAGAATKAGRAEKAAGSAAGREPERAGAGAKGAGVAETTPASKPGAAGKAGTAGAGEATAGKAGGKEAKGEGAAKPGGGGKAAAGGGGAAGKGPAGGKGGGKGAAAKGGGDKKPVVRQDGGGGPIAGGGGGGGGGAKSPKNPDEDPEFQKVKGKTQATAGKERLHPTGASQADAAQGAAVGPANEVSSKAGAAQAGEMDAQQPKAFDRAAFKAALLAKIAELTPKTLEDADKFKDSGQTAEVKGAVTSEVGASKDDSQKDIKAKTDETPNQSGIAPKPVTPLPPSDPGSKPGSVGAAGAAPKPKTESEVSMKDQSKRVDDEWKKTELDDKDVAKSNEPKFQKSVEGRDKAKKDVEERPKQYRAGEQAEVAQAQSQAEGTAQVAVSAMHGDKVNTTNKVATGQGGTKSKDEKERLRIHTEMQAIFDRTKAAVDNRLQKLDTDVAATFDQGADAARQKFDSYVDKRMSDYKDDRYGGFGGGALWLKDKLLGMPDEVNAFYEEGRAAYVADMDTVIDKVSIAVETGLAEAKKLIAQGKQEIQAYINGLDPALRAMGKEEGENFQSQFSDLENQVNEKSSTLVDSLAQKYVDRLSKLDDDIKSMKEANKGLVDAVVGAIKDVIKTILELKNMLLNVIAKAAAAIKKIIKDPIGFLGNLVAGVKAGIMGFKDKIGQYLQEGLMGWLLGALGSAGITMPASLDLKGILGLVMQILGLTYANIRARAVAIVGEPVVKALETAAEIFKILITEGPSGLWKYIQDQIGNLKEMFIEGLKSFIIEKIVIAGITWLISMLNPASAFVKACKMIVDVVIFFVQRASQIMTLVNAVIDSISAIAAGNIAVAANLVEQALARAVPVVLSFLAALLGLGGIAGKIRSIIEKIRAPINKAIDWVIRKAVDIVKSLGKLFGVGKKKDEKPGDEKWNTSVAALHPDLEKLKKEGVTEKKLRSTLPRLASKHGFKRLDIASNAKGWQVKGSMSPERPIEQLDYPGSKADPFDLDWPKPAASGYPHLFFGGPSDVRIPQSELATKVGQVVNGHKVKEFPPVGGGTLPGGASVGITTPLEVGTVIGPVGSASTPGGGRINKAFHPYGFRAQSEGLDGDHVQEIQFGGHDVIGNLWPLAKGMNRGAGSTLAQKTVYHKKLAEGVKVSELKADTAHQFWFRITSTKG